MPNTCTVCASDRVADVDRALLSGKAARRVAATYGLSYGAVRRHSSSHLSTAPPPPGSASGGGAGAPAVSRLEQQIVDLDVALSQTASAAGRTQLLRERRLTLEAIGKLEGPAEREHIPLAEHPDWPLWWDALVIVLERYPAAMADVREAWARLGKDDS